MTDFKKLEQVSPESYPKFTFSRKGGYVEDQVDQTVQNIFNDVNKVISYQNDTVEELLRVENDLVDVRGSVEGLTNRLAEKVKENETLKTQVAEVDAVVDTVRSDYEDRIAALQRELEAAKVQLAQHSADLSEAREAVVTVVESAPVSPSAPEYSFEDEAAAATSLLIAAEKTAKAYIAEAREKAEALVADAETNIDDLRNEVVLLTSSRDAALETLREFHLEQLEKISSLSGQVRPEDVVVETDADVAAEADAYAEAAETIHSGEELSDATLHDVADEEDLDDEGVDEDVTYEAVKEQEWAVEPVAETVVDDEEEESLSPEHTIVEDEDNETVEKEEK
jgi:uncharacterized protein YeeX (DUF496 family)